jgi:hypothetical protein
MPQDEEVILGVVLPGRVVVPAIRDRGGNVTGFTSDAQGQLTLLGQTATDPGTVDSSATPDGRFLYVQAGGNGSVDEFSVAAGTLTEIGSVVVPGAVGGEGIAAA